MGSTKQIRLKVLYLLEITTYTATVDGERCSSNKSDFYCLEGLSNAYSNMYSSVFLFDFTRVFLTKLEHMCCSTITLQHHQKITHLSM